MNNKIPSITVLRTVMAAFFLVLFVGVGFSQSVDVPHKMSYQGLVTNGSGKPIADGAHILTITLYNDAMGTSPFWTSTFSTTTANGIFNVILGDSGAILPAPLTSPLWLGVAVDHNAELRPLTEVVSAPYALGIADSTISTAKIQDAAVTTSKIADNYVGQVSFDNQSYKTVKGKTLDILVGANLSLKVDTTGGDMHATLDALGSGTLNTITATPNGGLFVTLPQNGNQNISIANQGIVTNMYADSSITNAKLQTGSVDSRVIKDGSIQGIDIAQNTITGSNIANYTIVGQNIAIPLVMVRRDPGDVLDISNTADLAGSSPVVNFGGHSSDGTPVVNVIGNVQNGGAVAVTDSVGTALQLTALGSNSAVDVVAGGVRASAPASADQFASTYVVASQTANNLLTISNNLVRSNSTVMISYETSPSNYQDVEVAQGSVTNGSFQVAASGPYFNAGDKIHYIVINH